MNNKPIMIAVDNLLLDVENPRFPDTTSDQLNAIGVLVRDYKIFNLAKDIIINGLNPSENLLVQSTDNQSDYIVLEGNRRVAALKLLLFPNLISEIEVSTATRKKWQKLATQKGNVPTEVSCTVEPRERAKHWILLKHTGENDGIGIVAWDGSATARFRGYSAELDVISQVQEHLDEDTKRNLLKFDITNLERLFKTPDVRRALGLIINRDAQQVSFEDEDAKRKVARVVSDIVNKKINVSKIKYKDQRLDYISASTGKSREEISSLTSAAKAKSKVSKPSPEPAKLKEASKSEKPITDSSKPSLENAQNAQLSVDTDQSQSTPTHHFTLSKQPVSNSMRSIVGKSVRNRLKNRSTVIPTSCRLSISHDKINGIYKELRTLDVERFVYSCGVLLRVFLELSLVVYAEKHSLEFFYTDGKGNKREKQLQAKLQLVLTHLKENGYTNSERLKGINTIRSNTEQLLSVETLHAYIHSTEFYPSAGDLRQIWANLQGFFEIIWNEA